MRAEGLEPPRVASPAPKADASTCFATPACNRELSFSTIVGLASRNFKLNNLDKKVTIL